MKQLIFLQLVLLIAKVGSAQTYTVETVPNTKRLNNSYVSNPDKLLSDDAVNSINILLDSLERKATAQIAVVMLTSIGDADVFDFAQSLFKSWGIGQAGNDNGLLILYVQDKRTVRFHTGYGLEGVLPDVVCKRIQTQNMVPHFKEGNINAGMIEGIKEVSRILSDKKNLEEVKNKRADNIDLTAQGAISFLLAMVWCILGIIIFFMKLRSGFSNSKVFSTEAPHSKLSWQMWLVWYYFGVLAIALYLTFTKNLIVFCTLAYGYPLFLALHKYGRMVRSANKWIAKKDYHTAYEFYQKNKSVIALAVFFPIPFLFLILDFKRRKLAARNYPRPCKKCNQIMRAPKTEATEDEFLPPEFIFEEKIKSVDYDVWKCEHCAHLEFEVFINKKTKYEYCPKCRTMALSLVGTSTIQAATTSSTGKQETVKQCSYCNKKTVSEEIIPMVVISSYSDSTSWSSSSSSDSGGSWGGGDSGGGGASSSW